MTNRWLSYCLKKARARKDTQLTYKLHAVIIRGGSVLAQGANQSASSSDGRVVNPNAPYWTGIHAEMDCVRRAHPSHLEGSVLYVAGLNRSGDSICTKPCEYCVEVLAETGLKDVYYVTKYGVGSKLYLSEVLV